MPWRRTAAGCWRQLKIVMWLELRANVQLSKCWRIRIWCVSVRVKMCLCDCIRFVINVLICYLRRIYILYLRDVDCVNMKRLNMKITGPHPDRYLPSPPCLGTYMFRSCQLILWLDSQFVRLSKLCSGEWSSPILLLFETLKWPHLKEIALAFVPSP